MRCSITTLSLLAAAAGAAAQTSSICPGLNVLEDCLVTTRASEKACSQTDYNCKCQAMRSVFGCFAASGCPDDPRSSGTESELKAWCAYITTTSAAVSVSAAPTAANGAGDDSSPAATTTAASSPGSTDNAEGSQQDNGSDGSNSGAAYLALNAGGVLAAVAGAVIATL